ncbi:hypothetical protein IWX49DRAFT_621835 [Phyllosticta citricarpa]
MYIGDGDDDEKRGRRSIRQEATGQSSSRVVQEASTGAVSVPAWRNWEEIERLDEMPCHARRRRKQQQQQHELSSDVHVSWANQCGSCKSFDCVTASSGLFDTSDFDKNPHIPSVPSVVRSIPIKIATTTSSQTIKKFSTPYIKQVNLFNTKTVSILYQAMTAPHPASILQQEAKQSDRKTPDERTNHAFPPSSRKKSIEKKLRIRNSTTLQFSTLTPRSPSHTSHAPRIIW